MCMDTCAGFFQIGWKCRKYQQSIFYVPKYEFHVTYIHETRLLYNITRRYSVPNLTNTALKKYGKLGKKSTVEAAYYNRG